MIGRFLLTIINQKRFSLVTAVAVIFLALPFSFFMFISTEPCRNLQRIAKNSDLRVKTLTTLSKFLHSTEVRSTLISTAGSAFNLNQFSTHFDLQGIELDVDQSNLRLYVESSRADKRFSPPFSIVEVGLGYARSRIIFENELYTDDANTMFEIHLSNTPHVVCGE